MINYKTKEIPKYIRQYQQEMLIMLRKWGWKEQEAVEYIEQLVSDMMTEETKIITLR